LEKSSKKEGRPIHLEMSVETEKVEEKKIEEIKEEDSKEEIKKEDKENSSKEKNKKEGEEESSDDEPPPLEKTDNVQEESAPKEGGEGKGKGKQTRGEKKSRKAMQKLGMKPFPGIIRVTVKRSPNVLFVIQKPDVYKSQSDTYIIFGEAKIEDLSTNPALNAVRQIEKETEKKSPEGEEEPPALVQSTEPSATTLDASTTEPSAPTPDTKTPAPTSSSQTPPAETSQEKTTPASPSEGKIGNDIEVVMNQANVSREVAVEALKKAKGDYVDAIMDLQKLK